MEELKQILQEHGDGTGTAQQHDPGICADERSRHGAQDGQNEQHLGSADLVEGVEIGHGDTQQQRHQRHRYRDLKAVEDGGIIIGLGEELTEDMIDGFIPLNFEGANYGETVLSRSTYYSGILEWAGIVTIHKSTGKGSYITVNQEYRNI